jgi:hypothetical protein
MNGVRKFLGGGGSSPASSQPQPPPPPAPVTPPPAASFVSSGNSSWPSQDSPSISPSSSDARSASRTSSGLVIRKNTKPPLPASPTNFEDAPGTTSFQSANSASTSASVRSPAGSLSSYHVTSPTRKSLPNGGGSVFGSPKAGPSSPRVLPPSLVQPRNSDAAGWQRTSGLVNIRDELLTSLLTSEAVVDSRECEILSAEEVEELKKV